MMQWQDRAGLEPDSMLTAIHPAHPFLAPLPVQDRLKIIKGGLGPDTMLARQVVLNCGAFHGCACCAVLCCIVLQISGTVLRGHAHSAGARRTQPRHLLCCTVHCHFHGCISRRLHPCPLSCMPLSLRSYGEGRNGGDIINIGCRPILHCVPTHPCRLHQPAATARAATAAT